LCYSIKISCSLFFSSFFRSYPKFSFFLIFFVYSFYSNFPYLHFSTFKFSSKFKKSRPFNFTFPLAQPWKRRKPGVNFRFWLRAQTEINPLWQKELWKWGASQRNGHLLKELSKTDHHVKVGSFGIFFLEIWELLKVWRILWSLRVFENFGFVEF
jgi:hypothetical protein